MMILFLKTNILVTLSIVLIFSSCKNDTGTPEPFGALPSERQLEWHKMDYYAFIHFNINTFSDLEWGHGTEEPSIFNPTQLDCRQWVRVCKDAGMKGIIITAKHHDGFCLWPSAYTEHSVKNSPWRNGKGDLLKELSEACKEFGLKMGIYMSPWDRNNPLYGTDQYNDYFVKQLTEVLTGYGEIFEVWFDGANGEGPNGKKQEYDWEAFVGAVRKYQPKAVIFSDAGPDVRWIGNEKGFAKLTNWNTLNRDEYYPGTPKYLELTEGNKNGTHWLPAEVNVSIRPGWYYHEDQDDDVKSVDHLEMIYYNSVGRGSNFLLNLPVDRRGLVHENEINVLNELKTRLDNTFSNPVPFAIPASLAFTTSYLNIGEPTKYLLDDDPNTFWSSREDVTSASFELELEKGHPANIIEISEYISLGQRVEAFEVEALIKGRWQIVAKGTTIGWKRLVRLPNLDCPRYRFNITKTMATPVISNIKLYYTPHTNYLLETDYDFNNRMNWWRDDRFGMFINWSTNGKDSKQFKPFNFNAEKWVETAKSTGIQYIVIPSKNRDGLCLWESELTDYNIIDTAPFKRDLLKELSNACKQEEIKLGFYYSLIDEHYSNAKALNENGLKEKQDFQKYVNDYIKPQIQELIEKYDPAILWFDGDWIPEWTHENGLDLYQFVRTLKPEIIINNRVDKGREESNGLTKQDDRYAGDFGTPDRRIPIKGGTTSDWEYRITINDTFDFKQNNKNSKNEETLVYHLIDIAANGGNLLIDIEAEANKEIPLTCQEQLAEIGAWLNINGESIFETRPCTINSENENIRFTQRGENIVYAIVLAPISKQIILKNIKPAKNSKVLLLGYGTPLEWEMSKSNEVVITLPENLPFKHPFSFKIQTERTANLN